MRIRILLSAFCTVLVTVGCANQSNGTTSSPRLSNGIAATPSQALTSGSSAAWIADYAAVNSFHELAQLSAEDEDYVQAAEYWEIAGSHGDKLPRGSGPGLWMSLSSAYGYSTGDQPDNAIRMLTTAIDRGFRNPEQFQDPSFSSLADHPGFGKLLKAVQDEAGTYRSQRADPESAKLIFEDVENFWTAYDRAGKAESESRKAALFRAFYLAPGTPGLIDYHWLKTISMEKLVKKIDESPDFYDGIRDQTLRAASYEPQIREGFRKLEALYPDAYFPDVTFVIGRLNSGGTAGPAGMLIGLDVWSWTEGVSLEGVSEGFQRILQNNDLERLPYIVVHEQIHALQSYSAENSLLTSSLQEGSADFLAMKAMPNSAPTYYQWGLEREESVWRKFQAALEAGDGNDEWIGNNDSGTEEWPADLGYFVGARICEAYYRQAADKQQAIRDLLYVSDAEAILDASGYDGQVSLE